LGLWHCFGFCLALGIVCGHTFRCSRDLALGMGFGRGFGRGRELVHAHNIEVLVFITNTNIKEKERQKEAKACITPQAPAWEAYQKRLKEIEWGNEYNSAQNEK